jgi:hypothetical protein
LFKSLTYKTKNKLLIVVFFLLAFTAYHLAIKRTFIAYHVYTNAKEKVLLASNAPIMAARLQKELLQMDAKIGSKNKNGEDYEQELLEVITNYCQKNGAVLREFPRNVTSDKGDLQIETNLFVVQGDFSTLLNLVYLLEQEKNIGRVASVLYQLQKDVRSKEMALTATIYLQNVKKKNNEK